ncbi:hypothetical protein [Devosia sp. A449]
MPDKAARRYGAAANGGYFMRIIAALALACMSCTGANAQAFGTHLGMKLEDFAIVADGDPFIEVVPPQPNATFVKYYASIGRSIGLCEIQGFSQMYATEEEQESAFRGVKAQLGDIYTAEEDASYANTATFYPADNLNRDPYPKVFLRYLYNSRHIEIWYSFRNAWDCKADNDAYSVDATGL